MVLGWFVEDCRQTIRGRTHKHLFMYWSFGKHRLGFLLVSLRRGELRMCDRGVKASWWAFWSRRNVWVVGCQHVLPHGCFHNGSGIHVHNGSHIGKVGMALRYPVHFGRSIGVQGGVGWCSEHGFPLS